MMDTDGDVDMLHEQQNTKQCFAPIQNRKLASPLVPSVCSLCPSMDLIVLAVADTLWIHRTVSWQRLATWKLEDEDCTVCSVCWAPDGRSLAVALSNGTIALHFVEALSSDEDSGELQTLSLPRVVSLSWAHVGRPHSSWILSEDELEREATWRYQSRFLDRASAFLPPSSYHIQEHGAHVGAVLNNSPSCHTPLSLLCATTQDDEIHLYLHGRYAIATLQCSELPTSMVCTSNLTHLLVQGPSSRLRLYHLPALSQYRYPLQVISSLYCSMTSHLLAIQQCMKEVSAAWKSSLKPLDTKLDNLKRLLKNYDISRDVRTVLHEHIIVGCVDSDQVTSVLEQFFSGVQMNDQLIQRLERSLHSAVANVETLARRGLLSPARSLAYEAGDLQSEPLVSANSSVELQRAISLLVLAAEDAVARIVEARFRLRDLVSWLRSAGSQVKARGTPPDSGQRENAKKRRVPHAVTERMAAYLMPGENHNVTEVDSVTESLIGITITDFFSQDKDFLSVRRPMSPKSVDILGAKSTESKRPTVAFAYKSTREVMNTVFEQPKTFVSRSISQIDFNISSTREEDAPICAIHARMGGNLDNLSLDSVDPSQFFSPRLVPGEEAVGCCRSWSIISRVTSFQGGDNNSIQLFALPLGWKSGDSTDEDMDDEEHCRIPFYLSCRLVLPPLFQVKEIAFYGDDGNSSLSAGTDEGGTGNEGRQAMGLLVSCPVSEEAATLTAEELWLLPYDKAVFHLVAFPSDIENVTVIDLDERALVGDSINSIKPVQDGQDEDNDESGLVYAKTRRVSVKDAAPSSRMLMSGSRGVGGILTTATTHVELDLYDMEEDEDGSDDDDDVDDAEV